MAKEGLHNILTIDVEEWFQTSRLEPCMAGQRWETLESRVIPQVRQCLEILETHNTKATFFVLGWVAERHAALIREIDALGHEIACHGYRHRLIYNLSRDTFREYTVCSKSILEDLTGKPVLGYRATSFSIVKSTRWALDIIKEAGFVYDSSIYPIQHDIYGMSDYPRFPFRLDNGLWEIPPSTCRILGKNLPFAGGGYFRLYPFWVTRAGIQHLNRGVSQQWYTCIPGNWTRIAHVQTGPTGAPVSVSISI